MAEDASTDPAAPASVFAPRPIHAPAAVRGLPACSVVITAFEDVRFLDAAVASILAQDFTDFELIVIDDGAADPHPVAALAARDPRIRVMRSPVNVGTAAAANRAIEAARSDIIVRMDSDDLAEPARLGRLVGALRVDPELGLVGSAVTLVDEAGHRVGTERMPETDFAIRWTMLFHNPFYHSATAYRRAAWEKAGGYPENERLVQDHYLWCAMLPHVRARNLPERLTSYRINRKGLTATHQEGARARTDPIRASLWGALGLAYGEDMIADEEASAVLRGFGSEDSDRRAAARARVLAALDRLLALHPGLARDGEREAAAFVAALRDPAAWQGSRLPRPLRRGWQLARTIGVGATARRAVARLRVPRE